MSNFNLNDFTEEESIRPPDNTIREILVNNFDNNFDNNYDYAFNEYDYDNELQLAINESIKEQKESY